MEGQRGWRSRIEAFPIRSFFGDGSPDFGDFREGRATLSFKGRPDQILRVPFGEPRERCEVQYLGKDLLGWSIFATFVFCREGNVVALQQTSQSISCNV